MNANNHVVDILENNTTKINILGENVVRFTYFIETYSKSFCIQIIIYHNCMVYGKYCFSELLR